MKETIAQKWEARSGGMSHTGVEKMIAESVAEGQELIPAYHAKFKFLQFADGSKIFFMHKGHMRTY